MADSRVWTPLSLLAWTRGHFAKKGIESPRVNAEILLAHAMGCKRIDLYAGFEAPVPQAALDSFREMVRRRADREPIQYITGSVDFRGLKLSVGAGVFIPRPETEELAGAALERAKRLSDDPIHALDIGSGCGCIPAALCNEDRRILAVATDISEPALAYAARNLAAHGLSAGRADAAGREAGRVRLLRGDLFDPVRSIEPRAFHLVTSNPPYIAPEEEGTLQPEVAGHEPREALFSGGGGFAVIERIIREAPEFLRPGGWLLIEIGEGHGGRALGALESNPAYADAEILQDLSSKDRIAAARRR